MSAVGLRISSIFRAYWPKAKSASTVGLEPIASPFAWRSKIDSFGSVSVRGDA